jgi:hypothetical protein
LIGNPESRILILSDLVPQHEFSRIGIQVGLVRNPWHRVPPEVVLKQDHGHCQRRQSSTIAFDACDQFGFVAGVDLLFQETEDVK